MLSFCQKKKKNRTKSWKEKAVTFPFKNYFILSTSKLGWTWNSSVSLTGAADIPEKWTQKAKNAAAFNSVFNLPEILQMIF